MDGFLKKLDENGRKIVIPLRIFLYFGEKIFLLESNSDYLRYAVWYCEHDQSEHFVYLVSSQNDEFGVTKCYSPVQFYSCFPMDVKQNRNYIFVLFSGELRKLVKLFWITNYADDNNFIEFFDIRKG